MTYTRTTYCLGCKTLSNLLSLGLMMDVFLLTLTGLPVGEEETGRTVIMPFQVPICRGALRLPRSALACIHAENIGLRYTI